MLLQDYPPGAARKLDSYNEVWFVDTEFHAPPGHRPHVVCVVAAELRTGVTFRLWGDELKRNWPPYSVGPTSLFVAYYATAELECHLALGWPLPETVIDLYTEFVLQTNSPLRQYQQHRKALIPALQHFGCPHIKADLKVAFRDRIMAGGPWSEDDKASILDYCETDTIALAQLLPRMLPEISVPHAIHRGRFTRCVAQMTHVGLPIDTALLQSMRDQSAAIRESVVSEFERENNFGIYEGTTFKVSGFEQYLVQENLHLSWPRLASGAFDQKDQTFKDLESTHAGIGKLRELRSTLSTLRSFDLAVGLDGRNRTLLGQYGTITARCAPRASEFLFGPARWIRGLLKPEEGRAIAYLDYSSQEICIAGFLSGDKALQEAYATTDPYISFGKASRYLPDHATKTSHYVERELLKACLLGIGYGMQARNLAARIKQAPIFAQDMLRRHRETYRGFWAWVAAERDRAFLTGEISTPYGWRMAVTSDTRATTLQNWPIQSLGSEMLRVSVEMLQLAGITVNTTVHDAVVIESSLDCIDEVTAEAKQIMERASKAVMGDEMHCRVGGEPVCWPDRYMDSRPAAQEMWGRVMRYLGEQNSDTSGAEVRHRVIS